MAPRLFSTQSIGYLGAHAVKRAGGAQIGVQYPEGERWAQAARLRRVLQSASPLAVGVASLLACRLITTAAVTVARGLPLAPCRASPPALPGKEAARREDHAGACLQR